MRKTNLGLIKVIQIKKDSAPKVKIEDGGGSWGVKPTFFTCGKKHLRKYLAGTGCFFGCCKDGHKVRDCPTIAYRGIEAKQIRSSVLEGNGPRKNHFYPLRAKWSNSSDDGAGKL